MSQECPSLGPIQGAHSRCLGKLEPAASSSCSKAELDFGRIHLKDRLYHLFVAQGHDPSNNASTSACDREGSEPARAGHQTNHLITFDERARGD